MTIGIATKVQRQKRGQFPQGILMITGKEVQYVTQHDIHTRNLQEHTIQLTAIILRIAIIQS